MINVPTFELCQALSLEGVERQNDGYGLSNSPRRLETDGSDRIMDVG